MRLSSRPRTLLSFALLAALALPCRARAGSSRTLAPALPSVLARVPVGESLADVRLRAHAHLRGGDGVEYALVFVPEGSLALVSVARSLATSFNPEEFVVAVERRPGARSRAASLAEVVHDDGRNVVARANEAQAEALSAAGFDLLRLPSTPMVVSPLPPGAAPAVVTWDPSVAAMVAQVTEAAVSDTVGGLSGAQPVSVGGSPVTITTRHTRSGTPIVQATQYAYERFLSFGLAPSYHSWSNGSTSGRNVVADLPGSLLPSEVVVVCGHLDDMPAVGVAPGADDNASGSTGVLLAAQALSERRFQRTIRFVLFTGEEQGLYGSAAYAALLASQGANVVAVLNLDMIGWDGSGAPTLRLHSRVTAHPGYAADLAIATTFRNAASLYVGNSLLPVDDPDGISASDHYSFWSRGWPGVLAIEDDVDDFTPHYHTAGDTLATLNLPYFASFVKASVATAAHLAVPVPEGTLFHALTPCRVLDTRDATRPAGLGPPSLPANQTRSFAVASVCGIPSDSASLALNVTVVEPAGDGFVTLFSGPGPPPLGSNVHFRPGRTRAAASMVTVGPGASFSVFNGSPGATHLVVDVVGSFR